MTDDLTPAGAHAVRLAQRAVKLKAQRDHARTVAVALEQRLARVEGLADEWEHPAEVYALRMSAAPRLRAALNPEATP